MSRSTSGGLRATVVHESMFACTEEVAHAVAAGLRAGGCAVVESSACTAWADGLPPFDLLVVGAPAQAFSVTRPYSAPVGLRELLTRMGHDDTGRPFATFDTRVRKVGHLPRAAALRSAHLLVHRGYRPLARPQAFVVDDLPGPVARGELDHARAWGEQVAQRAAELTGAGRPRARAGASR